MAQSHNHPPRKPTQFILTIAAICACLAGCATKLVPLMPTPIIFTATKLDPLANIPEAQQWTPRRVYYATIRSRRSDQRRIDYSNAVSDRVSLGLTLVGFGTPDLKWSDLSEASTAAERLDPVNLSISGIVEAGGYPRSATTEEAARNENTGWIFQDMNQAIAIAPDKDIIIYVHGAKVNFYNACVYAAQIDHFMGRDMTAIAFNWPTRQNIVAYGVGSDVNRAYSAASDLATFLELLSSKTSARKIHILCWSAGARVVSASLEELAHRYPDQSAGELRARLRLGTTYFAAGDVPDKEFIERLPEMNQITDRIIVSLSSNDRALRMASALMGGSTRIGQRGRHLSEDQIDTINAAKNLEVVDVSTGSEERGFDITGHRYWFDHPWASTDVLLAIRSDFPPDQRGLEQGDYPFLWYIPDDYPKRLRHVAEHADMARWEEPPQ